MSTVANTVISGGSTMAITLAPTRLAQSKILTFDATSGTCSGVRVGR